MAMVFNATFNNISVIRRLNFQVQINQSYIVSYFYTLSLSCFCAVENLAWSIGIFKKGEEFYLLILFGLNDTKT
jgi:hypothetical protein